MKINDKNELSGWQDSSLRDTKTASARSGRWWIVTAVARATGTMEMKTRKDDHGRRTTEALVVGEARPGSPCAAIG